MGAGVVHGGSQGADGLDGGFVAADVSFRVVARGEEGIAASLAKLHAEAQSSGMALGARARSIDSLEQAYRSVVRSLDGDERVLVVAERNGEIVAMAQLVRSSADNARHRAEVQRVAVAEDVRGTGVGRRLVDTVEAEARRRGLTLLWLTTHADTDACAFYEAVGYTQLGVMPNYSTRPDGRLAPGAFYYRELT